MPSLRGRAPQSGQSSAAVASLTRATPLSRAFYQRSPLKVAADLIGARLIHHTADGVLAGRIVETEAYRGPADQAAHSAGGRRTARTEVMFGQAGHAYMFLLYGMHWAFNVVTGQLGQPHAVLVRALEPLGDVEALAARRNMLPSRRELTNGPGKLCAALALDRDHYGVDLCARPAAKSDSISTRFSRALWVAAGPRGRVGRSARINIDYAGVWVEKPWRFYERGNRYVSVQPRT